MYIIMFLVNTQAHFSILIIYLMFVYKLDMIKMHFFPDGGIIGLKTSPR